LTEKDHAFPSSYRVVYSFEKVVVVKSTIKMSARLAAEIMKYKLKILSFDILRPRL